MKTFKLLMLVLGMITFTLTGCKKGDTGPVGPEGERGEQGVQGDKGDKGDKGDDGNANVVLYELGPHTFTNVLNLDLSVSRAIVDNSMVLVYYNPSNEAETAWFASPGLGSSGDYQTRNFIYQFNASPSVYRLGIRVLRPDGSAPYGLPLTFRKIKVVFAEASSVLSAQARGQLDLENYQSVKQALHIGN